jgi:putative peptide zinc metalloprotease protein
MNLAEALNAALPDLPVSRSRTSGYPKLDPALVARENIEDGAPIMVALIRGTDKFFRFGTDQWRIIELFDGVRSYEEVANIHAERYGVRYEVDDLKEFTAGLDEVDFWYKTPLEKNIALRQKLESGRHQHSHRKSKWGDISHMQFSAWDPDRYFNRIYPYCRWIYTPWFTTLTLLLFSSMVFLFVANRVQIGQDTLQFYAFTEKSTGDLVEFWLLFLVLGFCHESAHGLTCKHYGAEVHAMGFHLIFLTPAFFVDVSEAWIYASRWQRLITILAGVWVEMILCSFATLVWWGTPPGSDAHDLAYKIMLLTGIAVVVVNMNPLIKLDGYYAFSEIIGFPDIKEKSTAYLSALVRGRIFRLPVEAEFVPRRRRAGYILYAVLSGVYSYSLLYTVVRFSHNIFLKFSPAWAFLPALALAIVIFRSRIQTFIRFVRTVYLDKKDHLHSLVTPVRMGLIAAVALILVFTPFLRETVTARFVVEPARRTMVRVMVRGRVTKVLAHEGQTVEAGEPLLQMESADVQSSRANAQEDFALTGVQGVQAELVHGDLSSVLQEHARARTDQTIARELTDQLTQRAPIGGVVMTSRLQDLSGSYLDAGTTIAEVSETRQMRIRIFVLEYQVPRIRAGALINLLIDGRFTSLRSSVMDVLPTPEELVGALEQVRKVKGGKNLKYYVVDALIDNDGSLYDGMTGTAKITVRNRSIAGMVMREVREFFDRKVW